MMHSLPPQRSGAMSQSPAPSFASLPPGSGGFHSPGTMGSPYQDASTPMSMDGVDVPLTHETVEDIPWSSNVVVCKEEQATTGVFGVGLKIDVSPPKPFLVRAVTGLKDPTGRDISSSVPVGDTLMYCNDRSVVKEGESIIETAIFGEKNSLLKLTLQSASSGQPYDRMVKRHVPIRSWEFTRKWYEVKDEFRGKDLSTDSSIVEALDHMRRTVIDSDGREMDFLAGIKKRGSHCGIHVAVGTAPGGGKTVQRIVHGSPAAFKGMQKGDVIVAVDGESAEDRMIGALGGDERIGSACKVSFLRNGRRMEAEVSRTQVASMNRVEELLDFIDKSDLDRNALKQKVSELERERQYEERVMAGRLNTMATTLLLNVTRAADTLAPPRSTGPDMSDAMANARAEGAALATQLQNAQSRIDELARSEADLKAQLAALRRQMANMVPASELKSSQEECKDLRERLESLRKQSGEMIPRSELDKVEKKTKEMMQQLRDENRDLMNKLRVAQDKNSDLQNEVDELKRKLQAAQEEAQRLAKENGTLKKQLSDARSGQEGTSSEVEALKRKLKAAEEELEAAKPKIKAAEKKAAEAEAERDALNRKLKTVQDENAELKAQVESLKKQLKAAKEEGDRLTSENEALKRQKNALEGELKEARKAAEEMKQRLKKVEDEAATLKSKVESGEHSSTSLQKDLEEAHAKLAAARKEAAEQTKQADALRKDLKKAQADIANLQSDLDAAKAAQKKAQEEAADLQAQLDALKRKLKEAEDKAAKLEADRKSLEGKLKRAQEEAAEMKKKLDEATKKLRAAEDEVAVLKGENASLKTQLKEASEANEAMAKELRAAKEEKAKLAQELQQKQTAGNAAKSEAEDAKKQLAKAEADKKKLKEEIAGLEQRLKDKDTEVKKLKGELEEATEALHKAQQKAQRLQEQLEAEQKLHEATKNKLKAAANEITSLKSEVEKLKKQLADALAATAREEKDHKDTRAALDKLVKQLAGAGLAEEKLRSKFLDGLASPLDPAQVLRLMAATRQMASASAPDKAADLLETCAADPQGLLPQDVVKLLKLLAEGNPKRTAAEAHAAVLTLNKEEPWSAATLQRERELLKEQEAATADELNDRYAAEVSGLKAKVKELLRPEFDTRGCTFTGKLPLTIRGREGATIYANIRDEPAAPSFEDADRSCPTPMVLLLEDTAVVTVTSSVDGAEMSDARVEEFAKQRIVAPVEAPKAAAAPPPPENVGVGMLLSRPTDGGPHTDISVKEIYDGYAVHAEGTIKVGDVLVEVDGQGVQLMSMDEVSGLIIGPVGSEVTLMLEKEEFKGKREELCADGLYTVKLIRKKPEERVGVGMLLSRPLPKEGEEEDTSNSIKVKEIYSGGAVDDNGEIKVGDTLLQVDGQPVTNMSMDSVERLIKGKEGTEVSFIFEKAPEEPIPEEGNAESEPTRIALTLTRKKDLEAMFFSFVDSGKDLLSYTFEEGWNSVRSLGASNPPSSNGKAVDTPKQPTAEKPVELGSSTI